MQESSTDWKPSLSSKLPQSPKLPGVGALPSTPTQRKEASERIPCGEQRCAGEGRGQARGSALFFSPHLFFFFFLSFTADHLFPKGLFCCVSLQVLTTFLIQGARRPRPLFLVQRHHLWTVLPTSVAGNAELRATAGITRGQRAMSGSQS